MKQNVLIVLCMSFVSTILIFNVAQIKGAQMTTSDEENSQIVVQNKQKRTQTSYEEELSLPNIVVEYSHLNKIEEISDLMVEDSGGRFKKAWALYLANEAAQYEIDPFLVYELLKVETGHTFDPELIGPETQYGHAYGMSQFMKNTAPWIAEMAGLPYSEELLFDPYYSMRLAVVYLDYLHNQYDNWDEALTAYHRGMTGMQNYKKRTGTARSYYAKIIQENAKDHHTVAMVN